MSIVHTDRDNKTGVCFGGVFGAGGTRTCLHNQFSPSVEQLSWGTGRQSRSRGVGVIGSCAAVCTRGRECDACAVRRHLPPSLPPTPTNVPSARTRFCAASCSMLQHAEPRAPLFHLSHVVVAVVFPLSCGRCRIVCPRRITSCPPLPQMRLLRHPPQPPATALPTATSMPHTALTQSQM